MLPDYADIRALTTAEPLWYDERGVPRYAPFHPRLLGIYDKFAVLVEIQCQDCTRRLLVGEGRPSYGFILWPDREAYFWTLEKLVEGFAYGDPPRHGCPGAGESMGSEERRVMEAWENIEWEWTRVPALERRLDEDD